jgi:AcrR family transcriptional regulator
MSSSARSGVTPVTSGGSDQNRGSDLDVAAPEPPSPDGRQLRRTRNREAVVEALLDLYRDGKLHPSAEEIAARSGLSPRSVFRYFDDVDDLIRAAIARQQARVIPLIRIDAEPGAPFDEKVAALVEQRFRVFDAAGNSAAVMRLRAPFEPILGDTLTRHREFLRSQVETLFASELARLGKDGPAALAAADVTASYEARHLLVDDQGLPPDKARAVMAETLSRILRPDP